MPAAGTTKIANVTKAMIIAEKRVGMSKASDIARKYGVARQTVHNIGTAGQSRSEGLSGRFREKIVALAAANLETGIRAIGERLLDADESLMSVVAATRLCYQIYRTETSMSPRTLLYHAPRSTDRDSHLS
jgi:hypothetical protein